MIIAIGAAIALGIGSCGTFSTPKELDEETLALKETLDKASWNVKAMSKNRPSTKDFKEVDKKELAAFKNTSVTQKMELGRWYALSAPEIPETYYYCIKYENASFLADAKYYIYKSTTINEEIFASRTAFFSAAWQVRVMENQPSTAGLEKLDQFSVEAAYLSNLLPNEGRYDRWHSFTASEIPGIIYYYFEKTPQFVRIGEAVTIYKGRQ